MQCLHIYQQISDKLLIGIRSQIYPLRIYQLPDVFFGLKFELNIMVFFGQVLIDDSVLRQLDQCDSLPELSLFYFQLDRLFCVDIFEDYVKTARKFLFGCRCPWDLVTYQEFL